MSVQEAIDRLNELRIVNAFVCTEHKEAMKSLDEALEIAINHLSSLIEEETIPITEVTEFNFKIDKPKFALNKKCDGCRFNWGAICGNPMMAKRDYSCWAEPYKKGENK